MAAVPRHDFYQTDSSIHVSVYVKGCRTEDVECVIKETSLQLAISPPSLASSVLRIDPLFSAVDISASAFKVLGSKIEVHLQKALVGLQWKTLQGEQQGSAAAAGSGAQLSIPPTTSSNSAAPRTRSKWDSFRPEDENGKAGDEDDAGIDDFFKKLYADADDETRRAMMKSYQESGGTALSTNWSEVSKAKVETKPPEGMEAKKW